MESKLSCQGGVHLIQGNIFTNGLRRRKARLLMLARHLGKERKLMNGDQSFYLLYTIALKFSVDDNDVL